MVCRRDLARLDEGWTFEEAVEHVLNDVHAGGSVGTVTVLL